jgi:hypothetical protein
MRHRKHAASTNVLVMAFSRHAKGDQENNADRQGLPPGARVFEFKPWPQKMTIIYGHVL